MGELFSQAFGVTFILAFIGLPIFIYGDCSDRFKALMLGMLLFCPFLLFGIVFLLAFSVMAVLG